MSSLGGLTLGAPLSREPANKATENGRRRKRARELSSDISFQGSDKSRRVSVSRASLAFWPGLLDALQKAPRDGRAHVVATDAWSPELLRDFVLYRKVPAGLARDGSGDRLWYLRTLAERLDFKALQDELLPLREDAPPGDLAALSLYELRERARDRTVQGAHRARRYYELARRIADMGQDGAAKKRAKARAKYDVSGEVMLSCYRDAMTRYPQDVALLRELATIRLARARQARLQCALAPASNRQFTTFTAPLRAGAPMPPGAQGVQALAVGVPAAAPQARALMRLGTTSGQVTVGTPATSFASLATDEYQQAAILLLALVRSQPDHVEHWADLGEVYNHLGNLEAAIAAHKRALKDAVVRDGRVHRSIVFLHHHRQWNDLIPIYEATHRMAPSGTTAQNLWHAYLGVKRYADALPLLLSVREDDGARAQDAALHLPEVYDALDRRAEAVFHAVKWVKECDTARNDRIVRSMLEIIAKGGGSVDAIQWLREAHANRPNDLRVLAALARSLALQPECKEEATVAFRKISLAKSRVDEAWRRSVEQWLAWASAPDVNADVAEEK